MHTNIYGFSLTEARRTYHLRLPAVLVDPIVLLKSTLLGLKHAYLHLHDLFLLSSVGPRPLDGFTDPNLGLPEHLLECEPDGPFGVSLSFHLIFHVKSLSRGQLHFRGWTIIVNLGHVV